MKRGRKPGQEDSGHLVLTGEPNVDGALLELADILSAIARDCDPNDDVLAEGNAGPREAKSRGRDRRKHKAHR